jgi:hypothetical protein
VLAGPPTAPRAAEEEKRQFLGRDTSRWRYGGRKYLRRTSEELEGNFRSPQKRTPLIECQEMSTIPARGQIFGTCSSTCRNPNGP